MATVEQQKEDVARDMEVYVDSAGNEYDFGFSLFKGWCQCSEEDGDFIIFLILEKKVFLINWIFWQDFLLFAG